MIIRTKTFLFTLILIFAGFAVYFNSLDNPFHFDDVFLIKNNTKIYEIERVGEFFTSPTLTDAGGFSGYRPLVMATYSLNYYFSKLNPLPYRVINLLVHIINSLLVFLLLKSLLVHIFKFENEKDVFFLSSAGSLIFLVHPINTIAINFIWKRTTLLYSFFVLIAVCWFINIHLKFYGLNYRKILSRVLSVLLMCFLMIMGLFSKENAVILPLVLGMVFVYSDKRYHYRGFLIDIIPLLLIAAVFTYFRVFLFGGIMRSLGLIGYPIDPYPPFYNYLLSQAEAIIRYISMLFYPQGLSIYHEIIAPQSVFSDFVYLRILFLVSLLLAAVFTFKKFKEFSFSIFWFFIFFIPTSFVLSLNILMDEIRVYLPMIAFCIILPFLIRFFKKSFEARRGKKFSIAAAWALTATVIFLFSVNTVIRNHFYRTEIITWIDAVEKAPNSLLPRLYLGNLLREKGYFKDAAKQFKRSVEIAPDNRVAKIYLGLVYQQMYRYDEAVKLYKEVLSAKDSDFYANQNLGILYSRKGENDKAIMYLKKAISTNIYGYAAFMELGAVYMRMGKTEFALENLYKAYTLNSYDPLTSRNLALLYFNLIKNPQKALEYANMSLSLEPNQPDLRSLVERNKIH